MRHSFDDVLYYFDSVALLQDRFYARPARALNWEKVLTKAGQLRLNTPLCYLMEVIRDFIGLEQTVHVTEQLRQSDLAVLNSLKRHRFDGQPNYALQWKNAAGLSAKARTFFQHWFTRQPS